MHPLKQDVVNNLPWNHRVLSASSSSTTIIIVIICVTTIITISTKLFSLLHDFFDTCRQTLMEKENSEYFQNIPAICNQVIKFLKCIYFHLYSLFSTILYRVLNPFQPRVALHIETSHLMCITNQITGLYMKCNAKLNWLMSRPSFLITFFIIKTSERTCQRK